MSKAKLDPSTAADKGMPDFVEYRAQADKSLVSEQKVREGSLIAFVCLCFGTGENRIDAWKFFVLFFEFGFVFANGFVAFGVRFFKQKEWVGKKVSYAFSLLEWCMSCFSGF